MSLLKYPGGKEKELPIILGHLPSVIENYYEPFVGGGAVYADICAKHYYINDRSDELIMLYTAVKNQDNLFFSTLVHMDTCWNKISLFCDENQDDLCTLYADYRNAETDKSICPDVLKHVQRIRSELVKKCLDEEDHFPERYSYEIEKNVLSKLKRMKKLEKEKGQISEIDIVKNLECSLKSAFYMYYRYIYNRLSQIHVGDGFKAAVFLFMRDMCYSSMYRYNKNGEFNVPYGGISYNRKRLQSRIKCLHDSDIIQKLQQSTIGNEDFYSFMRMYPPGHNDFIFIDPPYDTEFSTYAKNPFDKADQERLADYLLAQCNGNFMAVIKNTDFIRSLYPNGKVCANGKKLRVQMFDKKYMVSFKNRNDRDVEHLLITNY